MKDSIHETAALRDQILADPGLVLDDPAIMSSLVTATGGMQGENVIDLRGVAMERLEDRLERLEDTHRSVLAAAYDNVAGTGQIHRAVLALLDAESFTDMLGVLAEALPGILRVDCVRLVLESAANAEADLPEAGEILRIVKPGYVDHYVRAGRSGARARRITLRPLPESFGALYEGHDREIGSEAALVLDLGASRLPAMLLFGAEDVAQFSPEQGTDLLDFLTGVFERQMLRWLN
ncbi:DUF484 family protein [Tropicimonas sp.]|uniref:DUF484 family protein n=1 Tax=Tropicimonas sp. TaxID=2067044 RepID=UPI003A879FFE